MTWLLKHKALVVGGAVLWFIWRESKKTSAPQSQIVRGRIDSGNNYGYFDTNVLSPTFGEPVYGTYGWED